MKVTGDNIFTIAMSGKGMNAFQSFPVVVGGGGGCASILGTNTQIGSGTNFEDSYGPYNFWYRYSVWHGVYSASELGNVARQITGLQFYMDSPGYGTYIAEDMIIHVAHTTESTTSSNLRTDLSIATGTWNYFDRVTVFPLQDWTITSPTVDGWKQVDFDTTFCYNGTDNIVITVEKKLGTYISTRPKWRYHTASGFTSWFFENDSVGSSYYPNVPKFGSTTNLKPDIKILY